MAVLLISSETEFEAMHPRFTAVNMYRKMCEREHIEFKRNKIVDSIGVVLDKPMMMQELNNANNC